MKYKLIVGMAKKTNDKPTLRDINVAIDALDADDTDPFIVLEPSETIENTNFIQVLYFYEDEDDTYKYLIEVQKKEVNGFTQYKYYTCDRAEVKEIFKDYFLLQKSPDYTSWEDITEDVINQIKHSDTFFLYELAKSYCRDNKELINCYGYCHGNMANGIPVFQSIAEAIILLKDIINSSNEQGDVYFTEDRKRIYIDCQIPHTWGTIKICRFKGLLSGGKIHISCYGSENKHIVSNVSPLHDLERLLVCFVLIFAEKFLNDEKYFYTVMDYFFTPDKDKFIEIYSVLLDKPKQLSYFVSYEDCDSFNLSNYTAFSPMYENYKENKMNS